jgi:hypothetical protein
MKNILLAILIICLPVLSQQLPNTVLTPGDIVPNFKINVISMTLDSVSYLKSVKVCNLYKVSIKNNIVDHLIPVALGGSDSIINLWPQSYKDYIKKNQLELKLYNEVCSHLMTLQTAQYVLTHNWYRAYERYVLHKPEL